MIQKNEKMVLLDKIFLDVPNHSLKAKERITVLLFRNTAKLIRAKDLVHYNKKNNAIYYATLDEFRIAEHTSKERSIENCNEIANDKNHSSNFFNASTYTESCSTTVISQKNIFMAIHLFQKYYEMR